MKIVYKSILGNILLESSDGYLVRAEFIDYFFEGNEDPVLKNAIHYLDKYFRGEKVDNFDNMKISGTKYQIKIMNILKEVGYSKILTYSDIKDLYEKKYLSKTSARAVGTAIAKNKIVIFIPCHRIIGKNGKLTGYKYGLNKKKNY